MPDDEPERHDIYREGKVHVLAAECGTCIFKPHTRPVDGARVAGMVRATRGEHGATVVCHSTLYGGAEHHAICRGWYDRLAHEDHILRLALIADVIEFDPVPEKG
jgi:hypothetical protein